MNDSKKLKLSGDSLWLQKVALKTVGAKTWASKIVILLRLEKSIVTNSQKAEKGPRRV